MTFARAAGWRRVWLREIVAGLAMVAAESDDEFEQARIEQGQRRMRALPWLDGAHEPAIREVATWLTGGWGSELNEQAAQTVLDLHAHGEATAWSREVMCRRVVPGWMSDLEMEWVEGRLGTPNQSLLGAVRRYLQDGRPTAPGVEAETLTWGLEFLWAAEIVGWSEALDTVRAAEWTSPGLVDTRG